MKRVDFFKRLGLLIAAPSVLQALPASTAKIEPKAEEIKGGMLHIVRIHKAVWSGPHARIWVDKKIFRVGDICRTTPKCQFYVTTVFGHYADHDEIVVSTIDGSQFENNEVIYRIVGRAPGEIK